MGGGVAEPPTADYPSEIRGDVINVEPACDEQIASAVLGLGPVRITVTPTNSKPGVGKEVARQIKVAPTCSAGPQRVPQRSAVAVAGTGCGSEVAFPLSHSCDVWLCDS